MVEENKTYDDGVLDGYNVACERVLEALGIKIAPIDEEDNEPEFIKKPTE